MYAVDGIKPVFRPTHTIARIKRERLLYSLCTHTHTHTYTHHLWQRPLFSFVPALWKLVLTRCGDAVVYGWISLSPTVVVAVHISIMCRESIDNIWMEKGKKWNTTSTPQKPVSPSDSLYFSSVIYIYIRFFIQFDQFFALSLSVSLSLPLYFTPFSVDINPVLRQPYTPYN